MKLYAIAFTKQGALLQRKIKEALYHHFCSDMQMEAFLSARIYDELIGDAPSTIGRAALSEFCEKAWQEADAILFIGATGIAVRGIAPYVAQKDRDPAVLVADELGNFVIPLLSGHIGGANNLAKRLSEEIGATLVLTTATDINDKLAIDSWAVEHGYEVAETKGIAPVSSAILENKTVLLFAPEREIQALQKRYAFFEAHPIEYFRDLKARDAAEESIVQPTEYFAPRNEGCGAHAEIIRRIRERRNETKNIPAVILSPYRTDELDEEERTLQLVPKRFFVGLGARRGKDSGECISFYREILRQNDIHPKAVYSLSSIRLKEDEPAFHALFAAEGEHTKIRLEFFSSEELAQAQKYTAHSFLPSELVQSVTGVDNVCERSAVLSAKEYLTKHCGSTDAAKKTEEIGCRRDEKIFGNAVIEMLVPKTKKDGMTIAIATVREAFDSPEFFSIRTKEGLQDFVLRAARDSDVQEIARIYNGNADFLKTHLSCERVDDSFVREELKEMKNAGFRSCVLVHGQTGEICGIVDYRAGEEAYLSLLMLRSDRRGKGLGKQIYRELEELFRRQGARSIRVEVLLKENGSAGFWKELGFAERELFVMEWQGNRFEAMRMRKDV